MKRPHTPIRYLDRLSAFECKLAVIRVRIEATDPEVAKAIRGIEDQVSNALMALNRDGDERQRFLTGTATEADGRRDMIYQQVGKGLQAPRKERAQRGL